MRLAALALAVGAAATGAAAIGAPATAAMPPPGLFFDDFSQPDTATLQAQGWTLRQAPGHPGVPGARWSPAGITLVADPDQPGNRLLQLQAQTDGTPAGTQQAQLCQARKLLRGTYAARIRFSDTPRSGADGDPVIQTFYAVSPLAFDYDPRFSEVDWEYLPNGGWGSPLTRLYGLSWQTVRLEPWDAHNSAQERLGSLDGWHELLMQVSASEVAMYVDGQLLARHGGRHVPVQAMALQFNLWFSPGGLLPPSAEPRRWQQQVDWVFHAAEQLLGPAEVQARVQAWRAAGVAQLDTVAAPVPALDSPCNF